MERIGNTDDYVQYNEALRNINQNVNHEDIIFEAKSEPFSARNGSKLLWFFGSLSIGLTLFFIFLQFPKFEKSKLENFKLNKNG